mmetsp:Transcript_133719/g.243884  ORF Transcript_133719/g.243884 Transcript_133719/m.243884 type:complete len:230 (+) Transcript_133719:761-1450(+)
MLLRPSSIALDNDWCASSHAAFISAALLPCSASSNRKAECASSCAVSRSFRKLVTSSSTFIVSNVTCFCKSPSSRIKMWIWEWTRFIWSCWIFICVSSRASMSVCQAVIFEMSSSLGDAGDSGGLSPPAREGGAGGLGGLFERVTPPAMLLAFASVVGKRGAGLVAMAVAFTTGEAAAVVSEPGVRVLGLKPMEETFVAPVVEAGAAPLSLAMVLLNLNDEDITSPPKA